MFTLNCKGRLLTLSQPVVMGILNINNDSFYAGSRHQQKEDIIATVAKMIKEGATIIDIGGQSSRPGSKRIAAEEELTRVLPAIEVVRTHFADTFISIDTYYATVAAAAVAAGADMVNDISAGSMDDALTDTVAALQVPYILMHMQGSPATMQQQPRYTDITLTILDFFIEKINKLRQKGIVDIVIDPGFGFGKTTAHNFQLLQHLHIFTMLHCPLLLGVSRKSTIYTTLQTDATQALNGTTVLNTIALMNGASILRVHDVKEAVEAIQLTQHLKACE